MSKKEIARIAKRFKRQMQKIVDDSKDITQITIQIEDKPPVIIAEKRQRSQNNARQNS